MEHKQNSKNKPQLKLDWCSFQAAEYACQKWHYSKSVPAGKLVKIGVWENGKYIGCVLFSRGANFRIGEPYGLDQTQVCELTRVALTDHETPVTKIISIALKMLKKFSPGIKMVVSYADTDQGHEGIIYIAGNWFFEQQVGAGTSNAYIVHGKKVHNKTLHTLYGNGSQNLEWLRAHVDPKAEKHVNKGKYKYLMPLDNQLRVRIEAKLQGLHMRSRTSNESLGFQPKEGSAILTTTHQGMNYEET